MNNQKNIKPYKASTAAKKEQITEMFDNIAPNYDLLNRLMSLGVDNYWRWRAINKLKLSEPQSLLDMATGTADLAIAASRLTSLKKIVGVDISEQMLHLGKHKVARKKLTHLIKLETGDAENLVYPDNSFDAITVSFGVRNFENLERGLKELNRVLKPGGKLVILEFSKPKVFPIKQLFNFYFKYIPPLIGRLISKDQEAYTYLPESVRLFPEGQKFLSILQQSNFKSSLCTHLTFGICSMYEATK